MAKKQVKVGVNQGDGPPPGFLWNVWMLGFSQDEAGRFLNEGQYVHLALEMQDLATERSPSHSQRFSIDAIEDFFELRDWGGILYPFNVRVYFGIDKSRSALVVLGVTNKQNNGPTPVGDKVRMRRRWKKYLRGEFGFPDVLS